jgi:hypothetical protein
MTDHSKRVVDENNLDPMDVILMAGTDECLKHFEVLVIAKNKEIKEELDSIKALKTHAQALQHEIEATYSLLPLHQARLEMIQNHQRRIRLDIRSKFAIASHGVLSHINRPLKRKLEELYTTVDTMAKDYSVLATPTTNNVTATMARKDFPLRCSPNPEADDGISKAPLLAPSTTMSLPSDNRQEGLLSAGTNQKPWSTFIKKIDVSVEHKEGLLVEKQSRYELNAIEALKNHAEALQQEILVTETLLSLHRARRQMIRKNAHGIRCDFRRKLGIGERAMQRRITRINFKFKKSKVVDTLAKDVVTSETDRRIETIESNDFPVPRRPIPDVGDDAATAPPPMRNAHGRTPDALVRNPVMEGLPPVHPIVGDEWVEQMEECGGVKFFVLKRK